MKNNVKHDMNDKNNNNQQPHSTAAEPLWVEEWLPLDSIIKHGPLQVRFKLNGAALSRYEAMTKAGSIPPPIKVGRVGAALYLVDGWHRLESGALQTSQGMGAFDDERHHVLCLVATMTVDDLRWQAARSNLGHGVPIKTREMRKVFGAFIKAKQHHKAPRVYMSYREMGAALGVGHTTLRTWTMKDFPRIAAALGGDHGNLNGTSPTLEQMTLDDEHTLHALEALQAVRQHAGAVQSPTVRWELLAGLEAAAVALRAMGVAEPVPGCF